MSKHAVMPITDYVNACNALREKTRTTEAIKSGDIPEKVAEVYDKGKLATLKDSRYMNGKESGTIISVNDVTPIEHNVGVKFASKNLFDISQDKYSGVSYIVEKDDNKITVGYDTRRSYVFGAFPIDDSIAGKTVTVSAKVFTSHTNAAHFRIQWLNNVTTTSNALYGEMVVSQEPKNITFTGVVPERPDEESVLCVMFYSNANTADLENGILYTATYSDIQVELGTTATPYTPYISNFAGGENLIPYPYPDTTQTIGGITFTDNGDGSITMNGTVTTEEVPYFNLMETKVFPKGNYIISGNSTNGDMVMFLYGAYGSVSTIVQKNGTDATFSLTEDTEVNISFYAEEGASYNNVTITPQIVRADTIKVEVARYGKNLLLATDFYQKQQNYSQLVEDDRNCVRFTDSGPLKYYGLTFEEKTQYTISFWCKTVTKSGNGDATSRFFVFYYTDGTKSLLTQKATNGEWVYVSFTSSLDSGKSISHIGMDSVSYMNWLYVDIDTFQLEKGTATEYEPFTETIYTANADGTVEGVKSISPNMTLIPNNNAVTVECEYLRDIDLYIDNLLKSVAMIGGE